MLTLENLKFSYTPLSEIIDIPKLEIAQGERVFLHGPSGSGKTTLLGLLAGILSPKGGSVTIDGIRVSELSQKKKDEFRGAKLGYIFQMFNLIPYLSVEENITLPCELSHSRRKGVPNGDIPQAVRQLTEHLGIRAFLNRPITDLSVGQQQRVACARALLGSPKLIIADEPTSALDTDHREKFLKLLFLECERENSTLIFVSHDHSLKNLFTRHVSLSDVNRASRTDGN